MAASLSSPSIAAQASHSSSRLLAVRRHGDGKVATGYALRPVCQAVPTRRVATRAAAVREEELCRTETVTYPSGAVSTSASKKTITVRDEDLKSTWEHRAWVWGTSALLAKPFVQGLLAASHDSAAAGVFALALGASYFLSDFGTGVYHWSVDNYGSGDTPLVGGQIAAFQGHHVRPWTITQREFCNNVHQVFRPAALPSALLALSATNDSVFFNTFTSSFIFLACMSQQFHAWSHMKKSELPEYIVALQDAGLLISRKAHGAHHRAPFEGNYCIVSGFWNPILDQGGHPDNFFRKMERVVAGVTGVEPRCWYEPEYDWLPEDDML